MSTPPWAMDLNQPASAAPYPASMHYNPAVSGQQFVGFVAQELETVFPSMVNDTRLHRWSGGE